MSVLQSPQPKITINRRPGQNAYFDEMLAGKLPLRMMQIPGGSFMMGSPETELDRQASEGPQHQVTADSFFMGKYPITQTQWQFVAGLKPVERILEMNPSQFKGDNHPVEQVTWYEAVEFCVRLSRFTQKQYQLPTEAQWEYACRAGTTTAFYFGETISTKLANYRGTDDAINNWSGSYGNGLKGDYRHETTAVDSFDAANVFGLCDMHGNVWEWCVDHWHENYNGAPKDGSAWLTEDESTFRVTRGGSWDFSPRYCRSAKRLSYRPDGRNLTSGFRVCCLAPRTLEPATG